MPKLWSISCSAGSARPALYGEMFAQVAAVIPALTSCAWRHALIRCRRASYRLSFNLTIVWAPTLLLSELQP